MLYSGPIHCRTRWFAGLSSAVLLAGCTDAASPMSSRPSGSGPTTDVRLGQPRSEFEHRPRFDLNVKADGSLKPGHPIHLTVEALANFATADAEVMLTLPEVAAAEDGGWDVVVTGINEEFRPHLQVRQSFDAGDVLREKTTLSIPEPGYYHVIASAVQHRDPSRPEPFVAAGYARRDFWLWVDEHGGRLTETFDATLFSPGDRKQSGPRGSERKPSRVRSRDANITCSLYPSDPMVLGQEVVVLTSSGCPGPIDGGVTPTSANATFQVTYTDGSAYRPVSGAYYTWRVTSTTTGATVANSSGYTALDGTLGTIDCAGPTSERRITLQIFAVNEKADVKYNSSNAIGAPWAGSCGGHNEYRVEPKMAHLFVNVVRIHEGHRAFFPFYSEKIYAGLFDDGRTYYDHLSNVGELHMANQANMIFREDGVMFVTHEYGHSFQNRKLFRHPATNGLMRYTQNCATLHPPESASSFGCAFGEGFADWYAVVVRKNELPTWYGHMEDNWFYRNCTAGYDPIRGQTVCSWDGSIVQGAVAALLWDIGDSDVEGHDRITRTPIEVVDGIRTCEVRENGTLIPYNGMDHFIMCMEVRSPYQVRLRAANTGRDTVLTFFNTRASNRRATEPTGTQILRNNDDFRRLWLYTLYSKRPEVGLSPTLSPNFYIEPEPPPLSDCTHCEEIQ